MIHGRMSVAPGTLTALSGRDDGRAYYVFSGDLNQMGQIEDFLRNRGYSVVKSNVYPGFPRTGEDDYKRALADVFRCRVEGWWNQERDLIKYGIITQSEFDEALGRAK